MFNQALAGRDVNKFSLVYVYVHVRMQREREREYRGQLHLILDHSRSLQTELHQRAPSEGREDRKLMVSILMASHPWHFHKWGHGMHAPQRERGIMLFLNNIAIIKGRM